MNTLAHSFSSVKIPFWVRVAYKIYMQYSPGLSQMELPLSSLDECMLLQKEGKFYADIIMDNTKQLQKLRRTRSERKVQEINNAKLYWTCLWKSEFHELFMHIPPKIETLLHGYTSLSSNSWKNRSFKVKIKKCRKNWIQSRRTQQRRRWMVCSLLSWDEKR